MIYYEVIDKHGIHTKFTDVNQLLALVKNNTNWLIASAIHVVSIIHSENENNHIENWYFKTAFDSWNPESEMKLAQLSNEYKEIAATKTPGHIWVLRNFNTDKMQELSFRLHITKDLDISEYRKQFETTSIEKVFNHHDFIALLCDSVATPRRGFDL
jgi:hypothetical protein